MLIPISHSGHHDEQFAFDKKSDRDWGGGGVWVPWTSMTQMELSTVVQFILNKRETLLPPGPFQVVGLPLE